MPSEKKPDIFADVAFPQPEASVIDDVDVADVEITESKIPGEIHRDVTGRPSFKPRKQYPARNRNFPDRPIPAHDPILSQKRLEDAQRRIFTQAVAEGIISENWTIGNKTINQIVGKVDPTSSIKEQLQNLCFNDVWVCDFLNRTIELEKLPRPFIYEELEGLRLEWKAWDWLIHVSLHDKKIGFVAERKSNTDKNEFEIDCNRERNSFMFTEVLAQHLYGVL
jgi:hypothetical protein